MLRVLKDTTEKSLSGLQEEMRIRETSEFFLLFNMGSQTADLIRIRVSECGVFCLMADPAEITAKDVAKLKPKGIILSGGPGSAVYERPPFDEKIFDLGIPVLGICLGFQMFARWLGATVRKAKHGEHGQFKAKRVARADSPLFRGLGDMFDVLQNHGEEVCCGGGLTPLAKTDSCLAAASWRHLYGLQFHPECWGTTVGRRLFENFLFDICGAHDRYPVRKVADRKIAAMKYRFGLKKKVLLALSGGSDSSVVAYLLMRAIQNRSRLRAVYIKGLDRPQDEADVIRYFGKQKHLELKVVDGTRELLKELQGVYSMRRKRLVMRKVYDRILNREIRRFGAGFIAQGTLYTDISESGAGAKTGARKAKIKQHHNIGNKFTVPEIRLLEDMVKDTARNLGRELNVPRWLLKRHPFPGPGLTLRIIGAVTPEKLRMARIADTIYREQLLKYKLYDRIWQAGVVVTDTVVPCFRGDDAAQGRDIQCWAFTSVDGFTARPFFFEENFAVELSRRIMHEVPGAGKFGFSFAEKPLTTIEWG